MTERFLRALADEVNYLKARDVLVEDRLAMADNQLRELRVVIADQTDLPLEVSEPIAKDVAHLRQELDVLRTSLARSAGRYAQAERQFVQERQDASRASNMFDGAIGQEPPRERQEPP